MRQIFLDTETSGLMVEDGNRVVEIGCVEVCDRELTGNEFQTYLNPNCPIEPGAENVHGLSEKFLRGQPAFAERAADLLAYLQGADEVLMHNAQFDIVFMDAEFAENPDIDPGVWNELVKVDTLKLARETLPGRGTYSLDSLCRHYGIDITSREHHAAVLDAQLLAQVYLNITSGQMKMDLGVYKSSMSSSKLAGIDRVLSTRVLPASPEELEAHKTFMQDLTRES